MRNKLFARPTLAGIVLGAALCTAAGALLAHGNLSVKEQITVNASPQATWKMIGNYNHMDVWHPAVAMSTVDGKADEKGTTRVLTLKDGAKLIEVLLDYNGHKKQYTYKIIESPLPIADYESTLAVRPAPEGKSTVIWSSTFHAKGAPDEKAIEIITGIYTAGLGRIARNFE